MLTIERDLLMDLWACANRLSTGTATTKDDRARSLQIACKAAQILTAEPDPKPPVRDWPVVGYLGKETGFLYSEGYGGKDDEPLIRLSDVLAAAPQPSDDVAQLKAENERLRRVTHVSLPTSTMEHEFSNYHRRGFNAGIKQGQYERDTLRKQLDEARELLQWATEWNWLDDDAPSRRRIDAWLEANK